MRDLQEPLATIQLGLGDVLGRYGKPFVACAFTRKDASQAGLASTFPSSSTVGALLGCTIVEEPYGGIGEILLDNATGVTPELLGCRVDIGWGYLEAVQLSQMEPYWVVGQRLVSREGELLTQLTLWPVWKFLEHSIRINTDDATGYRAAIPFTWEYDTLITDIVGEVLGSAGSFLTQWAITYGGLRDPPGTDGIVDQYQPLVKAELGDNDLKVCQNVLGLTACVLSFRHDGMFLLFIDPTQTDPAYEYSLAGAHPFYVHVEEAGSVIPNKVFVANVINDESAGIVATYVGTAEDATSQAQIGVLADLFFDESISDDAEAELRARAALSQFQVAARQGEAFIPMHCFMELYDLSRFTDSRSGQVHNARVSRIERVYV